MSRSDLIRGASGTGSGFPYCLATPKPPSLPRFWSQKRLADIGLFPGYDVAPDGARVLALLPAEDSKPETLFRLMLNVDSELRRRATAGNK